MPLRNVATNYTFEQQRQEINLLAADVDTLDTSVTALQGLQATETSDSPTFNNLTLSGYLAGPATLTIDPAAVGDNTGTVVIAGNLQVDGTTTTVNSTTMTVDDLSITLGSGAANAAAADGAGIDVDGASATLYYRSTPDAWASNKKLLVNQTSENASRANLEVTSSRDSSFPQYSYGIVATDDAAYNVNPGSGYGFGYKWNSSGNYAQGGGIRMIKENTTDNNYAGAMLFYTRPMGDGPLERLRVTSDGKLGINVTSPGCQTGGIHLVHDSTEGTPTFTGGEVGIFQRNYNSAQGCHIGIIGGSSGSSSINFGDKDDADVGIIQYAHSDNSMRFYASAAERLRADSDGRITVFNGGTNQASEFNAGANQFVITNNDNCGITIDSTSNTSGSIHFADGPTGSESYRGIIEYDHSIDSMKFYTSATQRLSMNSVGTFNFMNGLLVENGIVDTTARNGIQAVNLDNGMVHYFQSSSTGTWKPNFRVNSTNTLNNAMNIGDFCSPTMIVNKGNSSHYADSVQVDGSDVNVDWLGGPPNEGGGNNTWDVYSYTILKTGAQAFKCWASVSTYNQ